MFLAPEYVDVVPLLGPFAGEGTRFVGFVGSRGYPRLDLVRKHVRGVKERFGDVVIVSGTGPFTRKGSGGRPLWGVDEAAIDEARKAGIPDLVLEPDWETYGKAAGPIRNGAIAATCTDLVAYWDGKSRGTASVILEAASREILRAVWDARGVKMDGDAVVARASLVLA